MNEIIQTTQKMVAFLFVAAVLGNLFATEEYRKYLSYATALISILLILLPVWKLFGKEENWEDYFVQSFYEQKMQDTKGEIERLGEEYETMVENQYIAWIRQEIASYCGVKEEDCKVKMKNQEVVAIYVVADKMSSDEMTWRTSLSVRYNVSEENIFIEERRK